VVCSQVCVAESPPEPLYATGDGEASRLEMSKCVMTSYLSERQKDEGLDRRGKSLMESIWTRLAGWVDVPYHRTLTALVI
jgi:hypothetical protein